MKDYLVNYLQVPEDHIQLLVDDGATRDNILTAFYDHLRDNTRVQHGDTIIMYFAGHGSSYAAAGLFPATLAPIESICPVDRGQLLHGQKVLDISDREINLFLSELCESKGNNITLILDCCFSGGATRSTDEPGARVALPLEHTLRDMLNAAELNPRKSWEVGLAVSKDWEPDMTSHVIIAACQDYQKAWETADHHGEFTAALLDALKSLTLNTTTYRGLVKHIGVLSRQEPLAAGSLVDSVIFNFGDEHSAMIDQDAS